jgi:hypothetical protein
MATNDYHFVTHWRVQGTVEEVSQILADAPDLVRWWPSVYLAVKELEHGDDRGVGKYVDLYTRGWLPYTLRWRFRVTESRYPHGFTIVAEGDFNGRGIWTLEQDGEWANITYDWMIRADKPLLRNFSVFMKPIFAANHRWAMAQGERSLTLELARCHANTEEEYAIIPAPPRPTSKVPVALLAGAAGMLGLTLTYVAARRLGASR